MRLLILSHRVPFPPNKGEKIRTFNQLCWLQAQGWSITLATLEHQRQDRLLVQQLAESHGVECESAPVAPKWLRYTRSLLLGLPMSEGHFHSAELHKRVRALLHRESFDAVLCTGSAMAPYLKSLSEHDWSGSSRPRLLMDFMDLDSDKWRQYQAANAVPMSWLYGREARLMASSEAAIVKDFDTCFFISDKEAELFSKSWPAEDAEAMAGRVQVMPNGVDTKLYTPGPIHVAARPPTLLFTGVMDYYPNVDAMLFFVQSAWPAIHKRFPGSRLIIAGMNPTSNIQSLTRVPGVEVTGFVEDILPYYHEADLFIAPFRIARGVQNKTLQALAVGLPVVTTQIGADGIDVEHGRHLLIGDSADELTHHVLQLIDEPDLYASLREHGMQLIREHYAWDTCNTPLGQALAA